MKRIFKTRKAVALALSLFLLIQTVVIATTVISAGATTTAPAAEAGESITADLTSPAALTAQGFKHYYREDYYKHTVGAMTEKPLSDLWYRRDNTYLARNDTYVTYNYKEPWTPVSHIVYEGKTFKEFEMNVSYYYSQHSNANDKTPLHIGFGKTSLTNTMFNTSGVGGYAILIKNDGNVAFVSNGNIGTYTTVNNIAANTKTDIKLVVKSNTATVYTNGTQIAQYTLPSTYNGGYVYFGAARANASGFSEFEVTELVTPDLTADLTSTAALTAQGFKHYYREDYYKHSVGAMNEKPLSDLWYIRDNTYLARNDTYVTYNYKEPWTPVSHIVYEGKTFKEFEMNVSYYYSQNSNASDKTPLHIGFGKTSLTNTMFNTSGVGGYAILIKNDGNVAFVSNGNIGAYTTVNNIAANTKTDIRLVVKSNTATVYTNGTQIAQYTLPSTYNGGYVYFGAGRANASGFSKFELIEYPDPDFSADFSSKTNFEAQGWKHYYTTATSQNAVATAPMGTDTALTNIWNFGTSGKISVSNYSVPNPSWMEKWYSLSQVVYDSKTFKDFDLDVAYNYDTNSGNNEKRTLYVGFGKTNPAFSLFDTTGAGGLALAIRYDGNVALVTNGSFSEYTTESAIAVNTDTNIKLSVSGTTAKVYRNEKLIATYALPSSYDGGYLYFGATRATAAKFSKFNVYGEAFDPPTPVDPNLYTATFNTDLQDSSLWAPYWAKDVAVDSSLSSMSFARGFSANQEADGKNYVSRTKQGNYPNGTALTDAEKETYSSTFNVGQLTYGVRTYKNFELNATYQFNTHSNNNSRILIGFGRIDKTKYATHADGGAVLEFDSNANVVYRDSSGTVAAETAAPASAAKTSVVSVKVVVDAWIAKVYVNETLLGSFIVPENYEGYVSIGATCANASRFYSLSILATEDNESGETRPTPVDPNTLPYSADFGDGLPEGWKSYWMRDMIEGSELTEKAFGVSWYHVTGENGHLRRTDSGSFLENDAEKQIVSSTFNIAQLALASRKFKNFEMEFEYRYVGSTGARIFLGLGRKDLGRFANHEDGGAVISLASDGNLSVIVAGGTPYALTTNAPESAALGNMVKVKVKVDAWLFTVWVNDVEMGTYLLPEDYEGYVSVGATKALPSELHSIKVTPLADNESGETRPDESLYSPDMQDYSTEFKNGQPDGWVNYWLEDSTLEGDEGNKFVDGTVYGYHWTNSGGDEGYMSRTDSGYVSRIGLSVNTDIENSTYNIANLTYAERKFNNFVMKLTYVYNSNGDGRVMLGFGKKDIGRYATHKDGGTILSFASSGNLSAIIAGAEETELSSTAPASAARFNEVNVTLTVDNWIATVNINGVDVAAYLLPEDYKGYISVGATRAKTSYFKSITVTPLADNEKDDIRPTEAPSFDTDWSEIIGKEPDNGIPPTVSGLPFLDTKLDDGEEDYIIRLYENGIPAKFYLDDKILALPWENITISELLGSMWIAENTEVEFTMPDGEVLEDPNTILISGLLMKVYEDGELSGTYKIVVGEYKADNKQDNITDLDTEKDDTVTVIKPSDKPAETGDNSALTLAIIVLTLSLLGAAYVVFGRKATSKRRG